MRFSLKPLVTGFAALMGAAILVGCASLGLTAPTNVQQQIAYGYSGITAALNTLASATANGLVTPAEANTVNQTILGVKSQLDTALSLVCGSGPPPAGTATSTYCQHPTNSPSVPAMLTAATATLAKVSTYLACKQAKGASCPLP